jgi:hypothetical protein
MLIKVNLYHPDKGEIERFNQCEESMWIEDEEP